MDDASRRVVILGSTGSVGVRAVEVVARNPGRFQVEALCAAGNDLPLLADQAARLHAPVVGLADPTKAAELDRLCRDRYPPGVVPPMILAGAGAAAELAHEETDVVLNAIDGVRGLRATLAATAAGNKVALANKESLVVAGPLLAEQVSRGRILPVDSEHSALAQCLRSGQRREAARLIITASGGPFHGRSARELRDVTVADALGHPTWSMGRAITVNSATLMNKGLEIIEAHVLFGLPYDRILPVVHPQSIVHSMVEFVDGSVIAQASRPDMGLPIAMALDWPARTPDVVERLDWSVPQQWNFEPIDHETFPAVRLAVQAGREGGCAPAVLNTANELFVDAFLTGRVDFVGITEGVTRVLEGWLMSDQHSSVVESLEQIEAAQEWTIDRVATLMRTIHR